MSATNFPPLTCVKRDSRFNQGCPPAPCLQEWFCLCPTGVFSMQYPGKQAEVGETRSDYSTQLLALIQ